jgi:hypothetical protein
MAERRSAGRGQGLCVESSLDTWRGRRRRESGRHPSLPPSDARGDAGRCRARVTLGAWGLRNRRDSPVRKIRGHAGRRPLFESRMLARAKLLGSVGRRMLPTGVCGLSSAQRGPGNVPIAVARGDGIGPEIMVRVGPMTRECWVGRRCWRGLGGPDEAWGSLTSH